jgi:hypothetical protein
VIFKKTDKDKNKKEKAQKKDAKLLKEKTQPEDKPNLEQPKKIESKPISKPASTATPKTSAPKRDLVQQKVEYIICPRCEINYINKVDQYCNVCKAEMGLVDRSILMPDFDELGEDKLCPICNINYIAEDEEICFLCAKDKSEKAVSIETEEDWSKDITDTDAVVEEELEISLTDLEEQEDKEEDTDEIKNIDDFEYVNPDDFDYDDEDDDDDGLVDPYTNR